MTNEGEKKTSDANRRRTFIILTCLIVSIPIEELAFWKRFWHAPWCLFTFFSIDQSFLLTHALLLLLSHSIINSAAYVRCAFGGRQRVRHKRVPLVFLAGYSWQQEREKQSKGNERRKKKKRRKQNKKIRGRPTERKMILVRSFDSLSRLLKWLKIVVYLQFWCNGRITRNTFRWKIIITVTLV